MTYPEFVEESSQPDDPVDDVIDTTGPRRLPRWLLVAGAVAVAGLATFVVGREGPSAQQTASAPSPSGPHTAPPLLLRGAVMWPLDGPMLEIYVRAHDNEPASDIVHTGSGPSNCKGVRIGAVPPQKTAEQALVADLRGYQTRDAARILDKHAGLCALQIRGRDAAGAVTVLTVTAPRLGEPRVPSVFKSSDTRVGSEWVRYVQIRTPVGWVVTFGAVGPIDGLPSASTLRSVASDTRLRW